MARLPSVVVLALFVGLGSSQLAVAQSPASRPTSRPTARGLTLTAGLGANVLITDWRAAGIDLSLGLLHHRRYESESPMCSPRCKSIYEAFGAAMSFGLGLIPYHVWAGNERGLEVRVRVLWGTDGEGMMATMGLAPRMLISNTSLGRRRLPSILHVLLPEIGFSFGHGVAATGYIDIMRVPFGETFGEHVAIDVEVSMRVGRPPWDPSRSRTIYLATSAQLRFR